MLVEIWSDVICPWCYIGKRRFAAALERFPGAGDVEIVYRAFQLDPRAPAGTAMPVREAYARKFGGEEQADRILAQLTEVAAAEGLGFRLDLAQRANTYDAHRLLAQARGTGRQGELKERLLRAYFMEGRNVADPDTLVELAGEAGLDAGQAAEWLASGAGADQVAEDLAEAARRDITAVPSYSIDGGFPIPGAQEPETFLRVLERMAARRAG